MSKYLLIGSEGNVGKPFTRHLKELGHDVLCADIRQGYRPGYYVADITNPSDLLEVFDWNPDYVILLSAIVSRVTCEQAPSLAINTNVTGLLNVIRLTQRCAAKLLFFSTSEVYGPDISLMREDTEELAPNNLYGLSKLLGEKLVRYYVEKFSLKASIVRPFMIYDEHEDLGDHRSAMIRFANSIYSEREVIVHEGSMRGWLHAKDAVRIITSVAEDSHFNLVNIGHPDIRSIDELANTICLHLGKSNNLIKYGKMPERMTQVKRPLLERQAKYLNNRELLGFEEGVKLVCEQIKSRVM